MQREQYVFTVCGFNKGVTIPTDVLSEALLLAFFEKSLQYLQTNLIGSIIAPGVGRKGEIVEKPDH